MYSYFLVTKKKNVFKKQFDEMKVTFLSESSMKNAVIDLLSFSSNNIWTVHVVTQIRSSWLPG